MGRLWGMGYGSATANVRMALQASSDPTKALPSPFPTAPLLLVNLISKRNVSPGTPPGGTSLRRRGRTGRSSPGLGLGQDGHRARLRQRLELQHPREHRMPGEVSAEHVFVGSRSFSATAYSPGTSSMTRSRNKKGSLCGRIASICVGHIVRSSMAHLLCVIPGTSAARPCSRGCVPPGW